MQTPSSTQRVDIALCERIAEAGPATLLVQDARDLRIVELRGELADQLDILFRGGVHVANAAACDESVGGRAALPDDPYDVAIALGR